MDPVTLALARRHANKLVLERTPPVGSAYSWWIYPIAVAVSPPGSERSKTVMGFVDTQGRIGVAAINHDAGNRVETALLGDFEVDDHNAAAILAIGSRPLYAFYARHNKDNVVRWRKSKGEGIVTEWEDENELEYSGLVTYAQVHHSGSGNIHLFTRVASDHWEYRAGTSYGDSWGSAVRFLSAADQYYLKTTKITSTATLARMAMTGHPTSDLQNIYYGWIDFSTGDFKNVADTTIGNVDGTNLPLSPSDFSLVYDAETAGTTMTRLLDVAPHDPPQVAFVEFTNYTDAEYKIARWNSGTSSWDVSKVTDAGDAITQSANSPYYFGGISFTETDGEIYVSREDSGTWYIEKWVSADSGATWTKDSEVASSSSQDLYRPYVPRDANATVPVIWCQGDFDDFTVYDIDIVTDATRL